MIKVKKLHPEAIIPTRANPGDAGLDLTAVTIQISETKAVYDTGLAFEIPKGFVGLVFQRSSICKKSLMLSNAVGVIDSGYRGSIKFVFNRLTDDYNYYNVGDRIGQLVIVPYLEDDCEEATELSETARGTGGFGSTGEK